jgi:SAM-dependent methyltransferase
LIGLDLNPFPQELKSKHSEKLQYVRGDALNLPFKENSFDAIVLNSVIEHITDVERCLLSAKRVLKTNGILIILSPCLITPVIPFVGLIRLLTGKNGIPVWGEDLKMCISNIFKFSFYLCHKLILYCLGKVDFRYRLPDLEKAKDVDGDSDAVYWANSFDIIIFLMRQNFEIIEKEVSIVYGFTGGTKLIAKKR